MTAQNNQITAPRVDLIDENTGKIRREWYMFLYNLYTITGAGTGITPVTNGGTGLATIPTNGQLLIGNGTGYALNTLGYGVGISVTNGAGTIVVANTGVLSNIAGTGISVSGATGNVTISNTGVLSWSGGSTGLTPATDTTGAITLGGLLAIGYGGTNGTATPTAGAVSYGTGTAYAFTSAGTSGQVLTSAGASTPTWTTPTTGTVTSVGLSMPTQFTVTNSPVTTTGTLTANWNTQTANYVLAAPNGSAGVPTFRALVAADVPGSALTKTDDTNVTLTLGGSPTTALLNAASLTLGWTGQLSVSRGGTGLSAGTSGGIPYFSSTSAMTSSALLTQYGVIYGGGAGSSPVATAAGTTGQVLTATTGGAPTWAAPATSGTVTSVAQSFTGGLISVAGSPITSSGTLALTVAGTSGGIPYFSSGTTWATSAALAASSLVIGGGAGVAPSTITTGTGVTTALGVNTGSAGAFVVNGGALGTPSSGTVTNLTGTASININGTVGATTPTTGVFTTSTANSFIPNSSTLPTNGLYLPAANTIGFSSNTTARMQIGATGGVSIGNTTDPGSTNLSVTGSLGVASTVGLSSGKISTLVDLTSANGLVVRDSATSYGNTNNFVLLQNSTGGTAGALTHTASQNLGIWSVGAIQFLTNTGATEVARIFQSGGISIGNTTDPAAGGLRVSGLIYPQQAATASAPAYVKGAIYFDTTLNKLRVGGASTWETITSV
jgi:hypothetical protein